MSMPESLNNYASTKEKAKEWGVQWISVIKYLQTDRIPNAIKVGNTWLIPKDATKPKDKRLVENRNN